MHFLNRFFSKLVFDLWKSNWMLWNVAHLIKKDPIKFHFLISESCSTLHTPVNRILYYNNVILRMMGPVIVSLYTQALSVWISCTQVFLEWMFPSMCFPHGEAWAATSNWQAPQAPSSSSLWRVCALTRVTAFMMPSSYMMLCFPWEAWFCTG